jgi:hypothetical protein
VSVGKHDEVILCAGMEVWVGWDAQGVVCSAESVGCKVRKRSLKVQADW